MERKLASIQKVLDVRPIIGADAIEVVQINAWTVVAKKDEFKKGDLCIYCEIDSFLPVKPEFEFLRKSSYRKMKDGTEGFRLKTIRLRGQLSQGLVLPLSVLNGSDEMIVGISEQPWGPQLQLGPYDDALVLEEWVDLTEHMGITKWEPPIPAELAGKVKGNFPYFLRKTDEERVQNLVNEYPDYRKQKFYAAEKLDGSSATYYLKDGVFGVCSRNLELAEPDQSDVGTMIMCHDGVERPIKENTFWKMSRELDLPNKLKLLGFNVSIQGELIGEGIQGNPYKVKGHDIRFFNVFNIDTQEYLPFPEFVDLLNTMGLSEVPVLSAEYELPETIEELLELASGKAVLNGAAEREGLVLRSHDRKISFKVISNTFLLKEKD